MKITFADTLTIADVHQHIPHAFEVPVGTTQIHMDFTYEPRYSAGQEYHNQMSLSLFDPAGPRGVYYLFRDYGITINEARTTPGFDAGPVRPGKWIVFVDTYRLLPPDPIHYRIDIDLSSDPITEPRQVYTKPHIGFRGPGWYRGDLHAHSLHSDASWDVPDLVQFARDQKWDFVSLTDHNTVSGLPQHESLGGDDLLTMGGLELTTYYGHAVVLGTRQWFEWRLDTEEKLTMPQLAQRALDSGALFITAHPMAPGDPVCSGCHWEFEDMLPGNSPAVEIWNGAWRPHNQQALDLYYQWLNEGHRLVATAGSDMHGTPTQEYPLGAVNVIYAEDLTEAAILKAIRQGHSYLSAGPELILSGRSESGVEVMAGDLLPKEAAAIRVMWAGADGGDTLRFNVDGRTHAEQTADAAGEASWAFAPGQARWCNAELRDSQNRLRAVTNPIFFDGANSQQG
jgi:hypothetical protein